MPTPIFCCGFECGVASAHWTLGANASFDTSTVRSGARSLRCNGTSSSTAYAATLHTDTSNIHIGRCYVRFATLPNVDCNIFTFGGLYGIAFKQSDSKLYTYDGFSGTFGSTGYTVTTGQWYRLDVILDSRANPWLIDGQVDGTALGQNTRATAGSSFNAATQVGRNGTPAVTVDMYFDDVITSNTLADYPLGAGYVNHFVPTSDGTHNIAGAADFRRTLTATDILNSTTTAYQLVDNIPLDSGAAATNGTFVNMVAPPNATDYVECVFGPAPGISTPTVAPRAVEVIAAIAQAGTGTGNMEIRMNDNGTTNAMYSATAVAGVTSYAYKRKHYANNIANGGVWTVVSGAGNFNNLRVRYGSPAAVDANPDQYFSSTMIEAEFLEIATIRNKIYQVKQSIIRSNSW